MSDFIEVDNVFLLDESSVKRQVKDSATGETKTVEYKIDKAKLQQIVDVNNKRFNETGDKIPLIISHNKEGQNSEKPVVGYAKNLRVADFLNTGRKGIQATFEIMKKYADEVRKHPRRSVEIFIESGKIDPVALLGGTTPERDLGLLHFESNGPKLKFEYGVDLSSLCGMNQMSNSPVSMDPLDQLISKLEQTDVFVWVKEQIAKQKAVDAGMTKDLLPQEESDSDELLDGNGVEEDEPEEESGKSALAGNGTSDKEEEKKAMEARDLEDIKIKLSSIEEANLKLKTEQEVLKVENAALKIQLQNAQRKDTILKLKAEGLGLDVEKELEYTKSFNDEQFKAHCEHAKLCYQKAPVGEPKFNFEKDSVAPQGELSGEEAHKIALKAAEEKISFSDALNKYKGKI